MVEIACRVVGALALHGPETQRALREGGACRMVCECLQRYGREKQAGAWDLELVCVRRIPGLTPPHDAHDRMQKRNGRGLGGQWEALEALADLAHNCPENRAELGRQGAVPLVVGCIERVGGGVWWGLSWVSFGGGGGYWY